MLDLLALLMANADMDWQLAHPLSDSYSDRLCGLFKYEALAAVDPQNWQGMRKHTHR
jgi:hypothetical protein